MLDNIVILSLLLVHVRRKKKEIGMRSGKFENSYKNLDYIYYDQVNKS